MLHDINRDHHVVISLVEIRPPPQIFSGSHPHPSSSVPELLALLPVSIVFHVVCSLKLPGLHNCPESRFSKFSAYVV